MVIQQEAICYQWFKQRLILSVSKPSISQRSQIKEDTVKPSVPAREFNLKAYAAITWHNDRSSLGLELRLADHRSQAARTATLPTAPPRQAFATANFHQIWPWNIIRYPVDEFRKTFSKIFSLGVIFPKNLKSKVGQTSTSFRPGYRSRDALQRDTVYSRL